MYFFYHIKDYNNITYHNMQITPYRKWNYLKILELSKNL